jgi:hypothetical protein
MGLIAFLLIFNFYHTFILFNDLSLNKSKYPLFYTPYKIPCGYTSGHKVGIKSAAFILRKEKNPNEILVSDKGVTFNFIYNGGGLTSLASADAIDLLKNGENIYKKYSVRFIGISADYPEEIYLKTIEKMGFNKIVIEYRGNKIYYVYDILKKENITTVIQRDEFDKKYDEEYSNIWTALPYYF